MAIKERIEGIRANLRKGVELVAVSKTNPVEAIAEAYACGERHFGESRPQELRAKWELLPKDIEWHMIGHLQSNKIKMILPFVAIIESLNSARLARAINKEAAKLGIVVDCLLEIDISGEESKSGWEFSSLLTDIESGLFDELQNIRLRGVMGIASNTNNEDVVRADFNRLKGYHTQLKDRFGESFDRVSMGMSHDYLLAQECGSTSVRVGSAIFGDRYYG
ncbi:MAG: YggS family pyridoxal phosphate-dependent enzyme [Rikenellaceae bacterium]